jgi:hypothetical protein
VTIRQYQLAIPGLIGLAVLHAWWTQPSIGPHSLASVAVRSLVISMWLVLFLVVLRTKVDSWSWNRFFIGALCGAAWMAIFFPMGDTPQKSLAIVSTAIVYASISELFASVSPTRLRAAGTGILMFTAQVGMDLAAWVFGWIKASHGM